MKGVFKIKKISKALITSLILILIVVSFPMKSNADGDIGITKWIVNSNLLENGDLKILEDITFNFSGDFNGVFRQIILNKLDGMENIEVNLIEKGREIPFKQVSQGEVGDNGVYEIMNENTMTLESYIINFSAKIIKLQ